MYQDPILSQQGLDLDLVNMLRLRAWLILQLSPGFGPQLSLLFGKGQEPFHMLPRRPSGFYI